LPHRLVLEGRVIICQIIQQNKGIFSQIKYDKASNYAGFLASVEVSCRSATIDFRTLYSVQKAHDNGYLNTDTEARNEVKISGNFVKMQQNNSVSVA